MVKNLPIDVVGPVRQGGSGVLTFRMQVRKHTELSM
jgi:hypothetical protein